MARSRRGLVPAIQPSATDLRVSEIFASIQGEGPSAGKPCAFLRLAHCNLACTWCDTRYSWDFATYDYAREVNRWSVAEVARRLRDHAPPRLVVTGGEPLLQQAPLAALFDLLPGDLVVEIETNGTVAPTPALVGRVDQWNVSPKLASSGEPAERRVVPAVLATFAATGRAWLKLVIAASDDPAEADAIVADVAWPAERVMLMPEAARPNDLLERTPAVASLARARGFAVSPRLHVERFGGERGR